MLPDFDFDAFNHDENPDDYNHDGAASNGQSANEEVAAVVAEKDEVIDAVVPAEPVAQVDNVQSNGQEEVDKW